MACRIASVAGLLLLAIGPLVAEDEPLTAPRPRRELREQIGASVNNLGLQNSLDLSWRWPLSSSSNPLLSDAHLTLGLSHALSPSYTRLGAWAEFSPLSVLDLRVGIEPGVYFGTFNSLMSFNSYSDPFSNDARDKRGGGAFGTAGRLYASPTLKMKAGPVVAAASADFEWWKSDAAGPLHVAQDERGPSVEYIKRPSLPARPRSVRYVLGRTHPPAHVCPGRARQ